MTVGKDLILAIDQGTTGTTCLIVDEHLGVVARATTEFPQHYPKPGWVEHDAHEIWDSVLASLAKVMHGIEPGRIAAIGVTNQRETSLIWDRETGAPLHRAIVWQDRRTADRCAELRAAGHSERIRELTGLVTDPYFSGTKLRWALEQHDGALERAKQGALAAGTIDTFVLWRLTDGQVHATEPSNASRTMLWPLTGGGWSAELCDLLGVPMQLLPEVRPCAGDFGTTRGVPGLPDGIPIRGVAGDQQSALFGQACFSPGQAKCTYGTGAFAVMNTGTKIVPSKHGLLTSVAWQLGDETTYCIEGSSFMAGAVVQWLRDELQFIEHASEVETLAASVDDSGGVIMVPAHTGLGAPHWRPEARGLIRGITRGTSRAHFARAALEGIALQIADLLEAMAADLGGTIDVLKVDGGAAANNLLMQIQADVLSTRIERPTMLEATALGAVTLAGLGVGMWSDTETLAKVWKRDRAFTPAGDAGRITALKAGWARALASC